MELWRTDYGKGQRLTLENIIEHDQDSHPVSMINASKSGFGSFSRSIYAQTASV
jgi:hypothetical protein